MERLWYQYGTQLWNQLKELLLEMVDDGPIEVD